MNEAWAQPAILTMSGCSGVSVCLQSTPGDHSLSGVLELLQSTLLLPTTGLPGNAPFPLPHACGKISGTASGFLGACHKRGEAVIGRFWYSALRKGSEGQRPPRCSEFTEPVGSISIGSRPRNECLLLRQKRKWAQWDSQVF